MAKPSFQVSTIIGGGGGYRTISVDTDYDTRARTTPRSSNIAGVQLPTFTAQWYPRKRLTPVELKGFQLRIPDDQMLYILATSIHLSSTRLYQHHTRATPTPHIQASGAWSSLHVTPSCNAHIYLAKSEWWTNGIPTITEASAIALLQ